jgi:thioredoxin reductase
MAELLHQPLAVYDVVIVGGGPAGLSAALLLGRCRRRVIVCDEGRPRNAASRALHGFLTRDGIPPMDLLMHGREELLPYDVEVRPAAVRDVTPSGDAFSVALDAGQLDTRTVLLATGVHDHVPDIPGLAECFGISVHHCPYCDGWEVRDKAIAIIGAGPSPAGLALSLKTWSPNVSACSNGARIRAAHRAQLLSHDVPLYESRIARLEQTDGWARRLVFEDGRSLGCDAVFVSAPQRQQSTLAQRLGCEFTRRGTVKTDLLGKTCVPGIYVVGDASRDVQFAIVAAAEGAKAGVAINQDLQARAGLRVEPA